MTLGDFILQPYYVHQQTHNVKDRIGVQQDRTAADCNTGALFFLIVVDMNDSASTLEAAVDDSNEAEFLRKVQLALAPVEDINDIGNDDSSISLDEAEAQFRRNAWAALAPLYETETMSNSNGNVIIVVSDEGGNMKIMGGELKKKAAPLYETETSITKCSAMMKASDGRGSLSIIGEELEKKTDYYGTMEASVADVCMQGGQLVSRKQEKWYADHEAYQGKAEHAVQAAASTGDGCKDGGYKTQLGNTKYKSHPHPTKVGTQDFALRTRLPQGTRLSPYNKASYYPSAPVGHLMREYKEHEALSYPKMDKKDRTNIICKEMRLKSKPYKKNGIVYKGNYKPINCYNLYYILERELILKNNGAPPAVKITSSCERMHYGDLASKFPPLPSRYESLELSDFWFLRRRIRQRICYKRFSDSTLVSLHGLTSAIAKSWKSCDTDVKEYVTAVAKIIMIRSKEITRSKNSTTSLASNLPSESSLFDTSSKFESKAQGQGVSFKSEHDPHVVNDVLMQQQQLAKLYCTSPSFYQQQMLDYVKTAMDNAELTELNRIKEVIKFRNLCLTQHAHQSEKTSLRMEE